MSEDKYIEVCSIDYDIVARFMRAFLDRRWEEIDDVLHDVKDRREGLCFCAAHSASECCCGAWDDNT